MRKLYPILFLGIFMYFSGNIFAQISQGGVPVSFSDEIITGVVPNVQVDAPDMEIIKAEDALADAKGMAYRNGVPLKVNINPQTNGIWDYFPDGSAMWRLKISSNGAEALGLYFTDFHLPEGAKLFVYTANKQFVLGAFTSFNNNENGLWNTQMLPGDEIIMELFLENANDDYRMQLDEVGYFYRSTLVSMPKDKSQSCEINVICSEGDGWRDQIRSVVKLNMRLPNGYYLCTGSLMNNVSEDCTPYVLTADHCSVDSQGSAVTSTHLAHWTFYFNYEASTCGGSTGSTSQSMQGCLEVCSDSYGSTSSGSDFFMVELNNDVPVSYNPYYNGWTTSLTSPGNGVGIHHPAGDIKKISLCQSISSSYTTHWEVYWSDGVTEGGSSGSPLFNQNGYVIGTLTGGWSACSVGEAGAGTGPNEPDVYGKMSRHWTSGGTTSDKQLEPWLAKGTGNTTWSGRNYCTAGLSDMEYIDANITTYPNPAIDQVSVDFSQYNVENGNIQVCNVLGSDVTEPATGDFNGTVNIDVSSLSPGVYSIIITTDQGKIVKQFMKQ
ncbi:MAG: hypothetical protein C0592_08415 [Marinilabiliales bacterium]|nr:MAG: hypothetical protein C0592_08415 [Marinilabiliales bacterium]